MGSPHSLGFTLWASVVGVATFTIFQVSVQVREGGSFNSHVAYPIKMSSASPKTHKYVFGKTYHNKIP